MARDKTFAANLQAALETKPRPTKREKRILEVLQSPPSPRRDRQIARWENHARAAIDADPKKGAIDWSSIDWGKVLTTILEILFKFLV